MKNVGNADRVIRILIGAAIVGYFLLGNWSVWGYLGLVLLATGIAGYCPLYHLFKINTARRSTTA